MWRFAPILIASIVLAVAPITGPDIPARVLEYAQPKTQSATLVAVGDVMVSRAVAGKMRQYGADYPFASTTAFLNEADITFGNLETPITSGPEVLSYEMRFRADTEAASALKRAGFDVLSLANNHMLDFGAVGINDTIRYLTATTIAYTGAGMSLDEATRPAFITVNGIRFAFLAYSYSGGAGEDWAGTAPMRIGRMTQDVQEARRVTDVVIVSMHAGDEYEPSPNEQQITFAHAAIDAGAEMVIGHHPHVIQPVEHYKGKYIFYSLGNFVFDQMWSRATREGLAIRATFTKEGVVDVTYHPVRIEDYAQPRLLEGEEAVHVLTRLQKEEPQE